MTLPNENSLPKIPISEALARPGRPRVMFGLPSGDDVKMDYCLSLCAVMVQSCVAVEITTANPRSCYVQCNREDIAREAIERNCDWIMWVDRDMECPDDTLMRLLSHGKDIVGATYVRRSPPYQLMGETADGSVALPMEGLVPMKRMPAGLLLTKVDVFRKLPQPWFTLTYKPDGSLDQGEDYYFTSNAVKAGLGCWCDSHLTSQVRHHGDVGLAPPQTQFPGGPR